MRLKRRSGCLRQASTVAPQADSPHLRLAATCSWAVPSGERLSVGVEGLPAPARHFPPRRPLPRSHRLPVAIILYRAILAPLYQYGAATLRRTLK